MIIGITGGIGSGKSVLTDYLAKHYGFFSIKTDELAGNLMNTDPELKNRLVSAFGNEIYDVNGTIDKTKYAGIIHSSMTARKMSDSIVHPAVWRHVQELIEEKRKKGVSLFSIETALPGDIFRQICSEIWYVNTDPEIRTGRLMNDRGYSEAYARSVISGQFSEKQYTDGSDRILDNSAGVEGLFRQADRLLEALL